MKAVGKILMILAAVFCVGALLRVAFVGVPAFRCDNVPILEAPSPDGRLKAIVFTRDCGQTRPLSTQVSIIESSSLLMNGPGNVFVADTNAGAIASGPGGGPEVRVHWQTRYHLLVEYPKGARTFLIANQVEGVQIDQESMSRDGV